MDSGKVFGSDEDSRSCESGWTMYLASPFHDRDHDCYYDDDDRDDDGGDSMDSDASSGPMEATQNLKLPREIDEQNSIKKKKTNEEVVLVETRVHNEDNHNDDDDGDNHEYDHDDGNDSYSAVQSYVASVRQEAFI